ncbi:MAG: mannose-6-phosphate isomerase [Bacteroidales bacterium]
MNLPLEPLAFKPLLKQTLWGGNGICLFKGITPVQDGIGESWELSHLDGNYSLVAGGVYDGLSIDALVHTYRQQLLGAHVLDRFGPRLPLLIKFIDARDDLSVQVHPNDALAMKRHNSFGKTEMWYVVNADPGAVIYSGFARRIDAREYAQRVKEGSIMDVLQRYEVRKGDVFFLPAGRIHAIGAGCLIAEIQQTSDITYRIYDYDRKDADGNPRPLHITLSKLAIDFSFPQGQRYAYEPLKNVPVPLAICPYFTTHLLELDTPFVRNVQALDSFIIYICMKGVAVLHDNKGNQFSVARGQTLLVPACTEQVTLYPTSQTKLLETYITRLRNE